MVSLKKDGWYVISCGCFPMTSALNHDKIYDPRPKVDAKKSTHRLAIDEPPSDCVNMFTRYLHMHKIALIIVEQTETKQIFN